MSGLREIHCPDKNKHIRKDLPMFIMSGDSDPVGNYGKGVWKTAHLYDKAGIKQIATMLFENSRHELLNEKNKTEVYHMVHMWISHLIQQC
jgi:alpha-beta hydrolase superfamily lysophospholipase